MHKSIFERHPVATLVGIVLLFIILADLISEWLFIAKSGSYF